MSYYQHFKDSHLHLKFNQSSLVGCVAQWSVGLFPVLLSRT